MSEVIGIACHYPAHTHGLQCRLLPETQVDNVNYYEGKRVSECRSGGLLAHSLPCTRPAEPGPPGPLGHRAGLLTPGPFLWMLLTNASWQEP